ncbi:MAG: GHMP kinase [Chloroflexota bacterium]|nr:GHMP kinase [Chloroflexota bacterium]MDQ5866836.1 GHMP kinase [Chloroflexota bacterium]
MWQIVEQRAALPADVPRCLEAIEQKSGFFDPAQLVTLARAPGRLDLMGGIADYSGSLVLQLPLEVATFAAAQPTGEPAVTVISHEAAHLDSDNHVQVPLASLAPGGEPLDYAQAREMLSSQPRQRWAAYVIGALVVLQREEGVRLRHGLRLMVYSEVPIGKGVSSSAALEVAGMQAVCGALGLRLDGPRMALLCQKVENLVVGAPCGIMDQMTSACGEQGRLLVLLCQPAEIQPAVALPPDLAVWGIDSGVRHAVSGGGYESVRVGAFMGYRMIAELAGLQVEEAGPRRVRVTDPLWGGYLCNISPSEWETRYRDHIPDAIRGDDFLGRYTGTTDAVTTIHPDRTYHVRQPTAHPIYEHHRVRLFKALLEQAPLDGERLQLLGELMYQSHASYSACGLGSRETDRIVSLVREAGAAAGLYGAKITGGGSGGTVAVLGHRDAGAPVREIAGRYGAEIGKEVAVLSGSSPGAVRFGLLTARQGTL